MADGIQVIELLQMTSQVDDRITTAVEHAMNEHTQPAITLEILRDNLTKIAKAIETEKGAEGSISPP